MNAVVSIVIAVLGATFNAGVLWAVVRQLRRDINGVGAKVRSAESDTSDQRVAVAVIAMLLCPEEKRESLAGLIIGSVRR